VAKLDNQGCKNGAAVIKQERRLVAFPMIPTAIEHLSKPKNKAKAPFGVSDVFSVGFCLVKMDTIKT
jgi:hypothetical protein